MNPPKEMASPSRKTMRASTLHFLPQEIVIEILTKLPTKTLARFRCVSKFFCSLISDPLFADLHRKWSLTLSSRTCILISLPNQTSMTSVYYTINYMGENQGKLRANRVLYLDTERMNRAGLRSSANGLICLFKGRDIAVCNLSTRKHIFLLKISGRPQSTCTLLGFDPISKKYKALMSGEFVDHLGNTTRKHWVFTLGVDTSWREINCVDSYFPTESFYPYYSHTSVYIDGIIYSINRLNKYGLVPGFDIASLDVGAENFHMIPFPDELQTKYFSPKYVETSALLEVDGRLAIIHVYKIGTICPYKNLKRYDIEIWNLEKSMKWGKHRTISIPLEVNKIFSRGCLLRLATSHFGEIVFLIVTREAVFILLYELGRQVWRTFKIRGLQPFAFSTMAFRTVMNIIPENMSFL